MDETYERTALKAINYIQKKEPTKSKSKIKKSLQGVINSYCKSQKENIVSWEETSHTSEVEFIRYLESKDYIELNKKRTKIESVLSTRFKKERKYNKKQKKSTEKESPVVAEEEEEENHNQQMEEEEEVEIIVPPAAEIPACPVCFIRFNVTEVELTRHIEDCLSQQIINEERRPPQVVVQPIVPPKVPNHTIQLLSKDMQKECIICLEDLSKNESVHRLDCMCVYHSECALRWWQKKPECPIHRS